MSSVLPLIKILMSFCFHPISHYEKCPFALKNIHPNFAVLAITVHVLIVILFLPRKSRAGDKTTTLLSLLNIFCGFLPCPCREKNSLGILSTTSWIVFHLSLHLNYACIGLFTPIVWYFVDYHNFLFVC